MNISKEDMWNYGKINKFYPPWRKPFWKPAFYVSRFLVNHGLKNGYYLSYLMILISLVGASLFLSNSLSIRLLACGLLILSYFIDMMDGKTSRMLKKDHKGLIGYLDNQFHVPMTSLILFIIAFRLYLNTNRIEIIGLGFILSWIFLWKGELQFSYEVHMLEVKKPKNLEMYEDEMARKTYHTYAYDTKGFKKWVYVCIRPFLDATDIWFALIVVVIFKLEFYYLMSLLAVHSGLLFYKFHKHIKDLKGKETIIENVDMQESYRNYDYKHIKMDNKITIEKFKEALNILYKHNIKCFLYAGLLLGYYRDNKMLEEDTDMDMGYIGKPQDFKKVEKELKENGWLITYYYNKVKILKPNIKLDITILTSENDVYVEDTLIINRIGQIMDALIWCFEGRPANYKYETILSEKALNGWISFVQHLPLRKFWLKVCKNMYSKIGYITTQFIVKKDVLTPLQKKKFSNLKAYIPNKSEIVLEKFYQKTWTKPTDEYVGRTLYKVDNRRQAWIK